MRAKQIKNFKVNKKILTLFLTSTIALNLCSCTNKEEEKNNGYLMQNDMVLSTSSVNMRTDNNLEGDIIYVIGENEQLKRILSCDNNWDLIIYKDRIGFVYNDFVKDISDPIDELNIEKIEGNISANTGVNLRLGPSTKETAINGIPSKATAKVLGKTDNGWYLVSYNGQIGYVSSEFVSFEEEKIVDLSDDDMQLRGYADSNVNFREEPMKKSKKIELINKGEELKIISQAENGWLKVIYNGQIGYVDSRYVSYNDSNGYRADFSKVVYALDDIDLKQENVHDSKILYTISKNETCEVLGENDSQYFVRCANRVGFIPKDKTNSLDGTFVVVDISSQKLILYQNNRILLETDIVTGKKGEHDTPSGIYSITKKQTDTFLTGDDYYVHIDYWMPFNGGIGLHDAKWRRKFGDNIYEKDGSHGCINIPPEYTDDVYENVEKGTKVIVQK